MNFFNTPSACGGVVNSTVSKNLHMTREDAREFALQWLPAWTGNKPKELAAYYSEHAFYSDPGIPNGVKGRQALLGYFQKLLAQNPDWVWTQLEAIPMEDGFLNKWHAKIPVGPKIVELIKKKSDEKD